MEDIEKVIQGIETCLDDNIPCDECPYKKSCCGINDERIGEMLMRDALELLKKQQEEVEPTHKCYSDTVSRITETHIKYCPWCGKKIKWSSD